MHPDDPAPVLLGFPASPRPLSPVEVTAILRAGILAGAAGSMSRAADVYLAGVCASVLADRLAMAGCVVIRPQGA